jgi:hypothetical protein
VKFFFCLKLIKTFGAGGATQTEGRDREPRDGEEGTQTDRLALGPGSVLVGVCLKQKSRAGGEGRGVRVGG